MGSASPVTVRTLSLVVILTAGLSVSCNSYRDECLHAWSAREKLQENPVGGLDGYYKNRMGERFAHDCLWHWLTKRPSGPSDLVHIAIDSKTRTFHATLVRGEIELDHTALRYHEDGYRLRLADQHYWHFEHFPLIYGMVYVKLWVGKGEDGLTLYRNGGWSGFIIAMPFGDGGGPGDVLTLEQVLR